MGSFQSSEERLVNVPKACEKNSEQLDSLDSNHVTNENVSSNFSNTLNSIPNERGFNNIVTLPAKIDEIRHPMCDKNIDLIAFNETRLDLNISDGLIHIDGYEVVRKDRSRNGGGVCIYLRISINYKIRSDLIPPELEAVCLEIAKPHFVPVRLKLVIISHKVVSSTNLTESSETFRSFTIIKKSKEPSLVPCGTPPLIDLQQE